MSGHVYSMGMYIEECCRCGVAFGIPKDLHKEQLDDGSWFYCPNGHRQHYSESTEQKLKQQLREKEREIQRQQQRAIQAESDAADKSRRYNRIRDRVSNGVCPCCKRTFENLARHMATKHPDFGKTASLLHMRTMLGLSQQNLADEIGLHQTTISQYERKKPVPEYAKERIESWLAA